jgi:hypothetical protein
MPALATAATAMVWKYLGILFLGMMILLFIVPGRPDNEYVDLRVQ